MDKVLKDFFISYRGLDQPWAEWIAYQLEEAHYSVVIQAWDFQPGSSFIHAMDKATRVARSTIAVLSPDYFASPYTTICRREHRALAGAPGQRDPNRSWQGP